MSLTDEQREKLQVSIDFLKRDMWNKYADADDIETLVIGNVNHIESCIAKLTSSEQEWKERAERAQKEWRYTLEDGETLKQQLESTQIRSARLIKKWKLRARLADKQEIRASRLETQLKQAIEVLEEVDRLLPWPSSETFIEKKIKNFLSSLSTERPNQPKPKEEAFHV